MPDIFVTNLHCCSLAEKNHNSFASYILFVFCFIFKYWPLLISSSFKHFLQGINLDLVKKIKSFLPSWSSIFHVSGVQQQGAVAVALLTRDTGGFGSRECFMWLKCITTDYISVPQFLALMLWKSANPSDKEVCNKKLQNFHSKCFMEMFCFLILVFSYPLNVKINPGSLFPPSLFFSPKMRFIYCSQGTLAFAIARHSAERHHAKLRIHLSQDTWILTCNTPCYSKHGSS